MSVQDDEEVWKSIPGYVGRYEASDKGRVRSVARILPQGQFLRSKILKPWENSRGYLIISLNGPDGNHRHNVHSLIALTFLGPAPDKLELCHNNGVKTDNRVVNLRYDTHSENVKDHIIHSGRFPEAARRIIAERQARAARQDKAA